MIRGPSTGCIRLFVCLLIALMCGLWAAPGYATFITAPPAQAVGCNPPAVSMPTILELICSWNQAVAGTTGPLGNPNWNAVLTDAIPPGGTTATDLTLKLTHLFNAPGEVGAPTLTLKAGSIPAGSFGAGAGTVKHTGIDMAGNAITNTDAYRYRVAPVPGGLPTVAVLGKHLTGTTRPFQWSMTPPAIAGGLAVSESRANGAITAPVTDPATIISGGGAVIVAKLPTKLNANVKKAFGNLGPMATDYTIRYTAGDPFFSDTTLSFRTGSPGSFEEADLGLMTDLFVGNQEFVVPEVFDANSMAGLSMQDLYVGVDLTQWLSLSDPFSVGPSPISISNGMSALLPGFLIATPMPDGSSPITFDPDVGYTVPDAFRFSGNVVIGGIIDGQVAVPEPGSLVLLGIGIATLGLRRLARTRAARA